MRSRNVLLELIPYQVEKLCAPHEQRFIHSGGRSVNCFPVCFPVWKLLLHAGVKLIVSARTCRVRAAYLLPSSSPVQTCLARGFMNSLFEVIAIYLQLVAFLVLVSNCWQPSYFYEIKCYISSLKLHVSSAIHFTKSIIFYFPLTCIYFSSKFFLVYFFFDKLHKDRKD